MKIIPCTQGEMDWHLARRGRPTASNFDRILTPKNGKLSTQADDYIAELIGDICSLQFPPNAEHIGVTNAAIRWGEQTEAEARRWYSLHTNMDVIEVGHVTTDDGRFGCSPDGLVGDEGGLELKCPQPKTQVRYVMEGVLPAEYKPQVHGALIVTGRPWWDFASYAPGLPPLLVRVTPDAYTDLLRAALEQFWERLQAALRRFLHPASFKEQLEASIALTTGEAAG